MNALRAVNRLTVLLLLLIGGLGYGLFNLWQAQASAVAGEEAGTRSAKAIQNKVVTPKLPSYLAPPISAFNEILERPLFEDSRTRPQVPAEVKTATPMTPLNLRLEGVAAVDERSVALVRDLTTKELHRLSIGMEYQGWVVGKIDQDMAELKRGDEIRELLLEVAETTNSRIPVVSQRMRATRNARSNLRKRR